jgi:hypothetical protein
MKTPKNIDVSTLRSFGLLVGGIFLFIAFWPVIKHLLVILLGRALVRWWAWIPGLILVVLGLAFPEVLRRPYKYWMVIGEYLGWFNTRLILGGIFFLLVTPMGFVMRLFGYDPLRIEEGGNRETYAIPGRKRDPKHMQRQF